MANALSQRHNPVRVEGIEDRFDGLSRNGRAILGAVARVVQLR